MKIILGKKLEMSQIFKENGNVVPSTWIEAGPCYVTQIKKNEKDGYEAVQVGFIKKNKKTRKSEKGKGFRYIKEFLPSLDYKISMKEGEIIDVSIFQEGDRVKISGISKGKGFQGGVKRWGFSGRGASHGVKHEARTIGSVGCSFPERVIKGKKMPGRMGSERTTIKNLEIIKIDKENNLMAIKGAVPGKKGTLLEIRGK